MVEEWEEAVTVCAQTVMASGMFMHVKMCVSVNICVIYVVVYRA